MGRKREEECTENLVDPIHSAMRHAHYCYRSFSLGVAEFPNPVRLVSKLLNNALKFLRYCLSAGLLTDRVLASTLLIMSVDHLDHNVWWT